MKIATSMIATLAAASAAAMPFEAQTKAGPLAQGTTMFVERPFPLLPSGTWSDLAVRLVPDAGLIADLQDERAVRLTGVPVPTPTGFELVDLELTRLLVVAEGAEWWIDDQLVGGRAELEATHSLWTGTVVGEPASHVYLAFTSTGSRGWIERESGLSQLVSVPDDGDWTRAYSVLVHESDPLLGDSGPGFVCELDQLPRSLQLPAVRNPGAPSGPSAGAGQPGPAGGGVQRAMTVYECKIAVETDFQYYQLFNNTVAATNYLLSLWGAVSERFFAASDTFITLPYVKIYSNSNDPWVSQDQGGSCIDVLFEFQNAWGGGATLPGNANLAHLVSGANLGCGVAYLDVLCDTTDGFAVSGNLHGQTSFPVPTQDSLNWDFIVTAHETGHNFGTPHTHDFCPPLDQCAPPGYFGSCQTQQVCQVGTIMGYCHLCGSGISNVQTVFHPVCGALMLSEVQSSCLISFPPASHVVRNGTGVNPLGYFALNQPEIGTTWMASVDIVTPGAVASFVGVVASGPLGVLTSFGEVLIDISQPFAAPLSTGTGFHAFPVPNNLSFLGVEFYSQAATFKVGQIRLQNAIDLTFGY